MNQPYGAVDPETAAERAHVLLESEITARLDAVRELAKRLNGLDAAIADYLSAWQSATRAGWTDGTLADIGLRSPESLPTPSGRRAADVGVPAASVPSATAAPVLAPVVALTPPPAPASTATAPAFGPAPTLASVAPLSAPTAPGAPASPSVVSTPAR
ncbi:hypothetical protein KNO15_21540 [Leifsonia shinshuensis]|uniref:hypothetical protein n=1 Tax=Leifsonia shinshuensis TaxID=150026 RepID=UPI001F51270F|nr:hypothetical protein [Leifsonia shinshuensis]MCI0159292.1 hypothetical protein [Leifsonia shinshuensis]